jgi:hypothetical protein
LSACVSSSVSKDCKWEVIAAPRSQIGKAAPRAHFRRRHFPARRTGSRVCCCPGASGVPPNHTASIRCASRNSSDEPIIRRLSFPIFPQPPHFIRHAQMVFLKLNRFEQQNRLQGFSFHDGQQCGRWNYTRKLQARACQQIAEFGFRALPAIEHHS